MRPMEQPGTTIDPDALLRESVALAGFLDRSAETLAAFFVEAGAVHDPETLQQMVRKELAFCLHDLTKLTFGEPLDSEASA